MKPLSRKIKLLTREISGETVIYDLERFRVHCLNETATAVWEVCEGATDSALIVERLRGELGRLVQTAVGRFRAARLINAHRFRDEPRSVAAVRQASPHAGSRVISIVVPIRARARARSEKH